MCLHEFTCRSCEKNLKISVKISDDPANIPKPTFPNTNLDRTLLDSSLQVLCPVPVLYKVTNNLQ
jgi:hypothetical protein